MISGNNRDLYLCPVRRAAQKAGHKVAVSSLSGDLTYTELDSLIVSVQLSLKKKFKAVKRGRFIVKISNTINDIALIFSLIREKYEFVLINSKIPDEKFEEIRGFYRPDYIFTESLCTEQCKEETDFSDVDISGAALVLCTSGTESMPKLASFDIKSIFESSEQVISAMSLSSGDRWLLSLPLFHVGGLAILFRMFSVAGSVALCSDFRNLSSDIEILKATHVSMVPVQYRNFLERYEKCRERYKKLRALVLGGSTFQRDDIRRGVRFGLPLQRTYGMTEAFSMVTLSSAEHTAQYPDSSGYVLRNVQLKTENNRIFIKGATLFQSYLNHKEIKCFDKDGWFMTGDVGEYDNIQGLRVRGRADNMFVSGGENIYPEEIESALLKTGLVSEVLVIPVEDKEYGLRPAAFVKTVSSEIRGIDIAEILRIKLVDFKIPDMFIEWDERISENNLKNSRFTAVGLIVSCRDELREL